MTVLQRVELPQQVCEAVAYTHSRLVIHRDLKPANVLVTDDGQVRLLDFGIAKLMQGNFAEPLPLADAAGAARSPHHPPDWRLASGVWRLQAASSTNRRIPPRWRSASNRA